MDSLQGDDPALEHVEWPAFYFADWTTHIPGGRQLEIGRADRTEGIRIRLTYAELRHFANHILITTAGL